MDNKQIRLEDVLSYKPETYLNNDEIALIQSVFKDNPHLIRAIRKIMLPSVDDPDLPIEELGKDVWLSAIDWSQVPEDQIKPLIVGRQLAVKFIIGGLIQLKVLAQSLQETATERALREKRNSTK